MKLEVGQFARLKSGYIVKILNVKDDWIETDTRFIMRTFPQDFAKSSYNIIDILEVGDYVNGKKIVDVGCLTNGPRKGTKVIDYYITPSAVCYLENEDIKSIVTKEQFEYMEYRIGE